MAAVHRDSYQRMFWLTAATQDSRAAGGVLEKWVARPLTVMIALVLLRALGFSGVTVVCAPARTGGRLLSWSLLTQSRSLRVRAPGPARGPGPGRHAGSVRLAHCHCAAGGWRLRRKVASSSQVAAQLIGSSGCGPALAPQCTASGSAAARAGAAAAARLGLEAAAGVPCVLPVVVARARPAASARSPPPARRAPAWRRGPGPAHQA
jgi:hypothetical protein